MRRLVAVALFSTLLIVNCGRERKYQTAPIQPPPPPDNHGGPIEATHKVRLLLFAGGNCGPCKKELPEIREFMKTVMAPKASRILVTVYVTAGPNGETNPSQQFAEEFGAQYQLPFQMLADPRSKMYRSIYKTVQAPVPAAALTRESYEVIKLYKPEPLNLGELETNLNDALK